MNKNKNSIKIIYVLSDDIIMGILIFVSDNGDDNDNADGGNI